MTNNTTLYTFNYYILSRNYNIDKHRISADSRVIKFKTVVIAMQILISELTTRNNEQLY